jgi:hypothetical protein
MAILRGFPPSNTISPSVRIAEKDLSFVAPQQSSHKAGLVGFASKGPINVPTVIQSRRQLNTVFGYPHPESGDPYLIYAAEQYLLVANELYVVRVADTDQISWERAKTASKECSSAGGAVRIVSDTSGPYNLDKDMYFRWRLNGVLASKTLVALSNVNHPDPVVNSTGYSANQLASDLNLQLDPSVDGIKFFATTSAQTQVDAEMLPTADVDASVNFQLSGGVGPNKKLVAGTVGGRVIVGGAIVQTFKVNTSGDILFSNVVSAPAVRATGGSINIETGILTLVYSGNLVATSSSSSGYVHNGISVDYKFEEEFGVSRIGVETTFSFGPNASLELVSVADSLYGPSSVDVGSNVNVGVTGLGNGMTPAQMTGSVSGTYDFTEITDYDLQVVIDGTDNVLVDNVNQVVDLSGFANDDSVTAAQIVNAINDAVSDGLVPGGFEAVEVIMTEEGSSSTSSVSFVGIRTLHSGRDSRLLVKNESAVFATLGFDKPLLDPTDPSVQNDEGSNEGYYVTAYGESPEGVSGDAAISEYGLASGDSNKLGDVSMTIAADSPGIDGNGTQVVIKNNVREGNFTMEIYNNGVQVESWGNLSKDETSRYYVETFLALVSDYVRVVDYPSNPSPPLDGQYDLSGGSDGIPSDPDDQDYLLVGNEVGYTGIYALSETEQIDIDLIAVPGHSSTTVVTSLINMCQNYRTDCMAIIDAPFGLTVKEIVHWQNGAHPLNTTRFDSDFAALYWPWVKIRDSFNNVDVWVPPSGSVMAVYARSDSLSAPWFAPAGLNRGVVPGITDVFSRPTLEERDLMYGNRNCVNPIVQYADFQDFVVWGQKTLQRRPTALDRVNVRRTMFVIEKRIRQASRALLFEPHDEIFRDKFTETAERILREVQTGRGINAFIIKADEELNTPDVIDRNEFRARIGIQPTKAVEFIFIEFSIHRTGSFEAGSDTF